MMVRVLVLAFAMSAAILTSGCDGGGSGGGAAASCGATSAPSASGAKTYCSPLLINYQFDSTADAKIPDLSCNGLHLHVGGCSLVTGINQSGLDCGSSGSAHTVEGTMSGSDNFAQQLSETGRMTIQFWMKYSSTNGTEFIAYYDNSFAVSLQGGKIHFRPAYPADVTLATTISPDIWHNVAITFDSATTKFYIDGALAQQSSMISPIGNGHVNEQNMKIAPVFYEGHYSGALDGFRVYDTVLSAEQVADNYNLQR